MHIKIEHTHILKKRRNKKKTKQINIKKMKKHTQQLTEAIS